MAFQELVGTLLRLGREVNSLAAIGAQVAADGPKGALADHTRAVADAVAPTALDGLSDDERRQAHATIRAALRQALELVEHPARSEGWDFDDPVLLNGQGRSSMAIARMICGFAAREEKLGTRLSAEGARFLDVGSGAGWISIAMARAFPGLQVDGIDIHAPALEVARSNLAETGLDQRIDFQDRNVLEAGEMAVYDAIWLPLMFLPDAVARQAISILADRLKPGGCLFVGNFRLSEDPLSSALAQLQATRAGGRVWDASEVRELCEAEGLSQIGDAGEGTGVMVLAMRR